MATVADVSVEEERDRLLAYSKTELRVIAEEIGAKVGGTKTQLAENILAKKAGLQPPDDIGLPEETPENGVEDEPVLDATEIEADAQADAAREEASREEVEAPLLPIKHLMLTMFEAADQYTGVLDQVGVNARVDELLALGYEPIEFQTLGYSPGGHKLFYVFELAEKPRYTRSMHIMRLLTPQPNPLRGTITGFQADAYISAFIEQGWTLIGARYNGDDVLGESTTGIFLIWFLVK